MAEASKMSLRIIFSWSSLNKRFSLFYSQKGRYQCCLQLFWRTSVPVELLQQLPWSTSWKCLLSLCVGISDPFRWTWGAKEKRKRCERTVQHWPFCFIHIFHPPPNIKTMECHKITVNIDNFTYLYNKWGENSHFFILGHFTQSLGIFHLTGCLSVLTSTMSAWILNDTKPAPFV